MHKKKSGGKKTLTIVIAVLVTAAVLVGGYFLAKYLSNKTVNVYPASELTSSYSWMDTSESSGTVTTDKIQSVYVSSTQQITEIYVEEGQTIHVGDPILAFDTTLSELELQRQSIKVDQLKLDIQDAQDQLEEIGTYRVGSASATTTYPTYSGSGGSLSSVSTMPYLRTEEGLGTYSDPLVYLWDDSCVFDESFIWSAVQTASENREMARQSMSPGEPEEPIQPDEPALPGEDVTEPEDAYEETVSVQSDEMTEPDTSEDAGDVEMPTEPSQPEEPDDSYNEPEPEEPDELDEMDDPRVYVVFEIRDSNALSGDIISNWELVMLLDDSGSWAMNMMSPEYDEEAQSTSYDSYYSDISYDTTVYYTASEIAQMKAECTQKIKDLELELKMAELEYEQLNYELSNGVVVSKIEGVVKTVRDVDEARTESKPVVLISGGGGYYITSVLGELDLGTVQVGDTVTVMSWENYSQVEGTVVEISPYPDDSGQYWFYNQGNQNVSLYPFKIFVDEDAELREGEYVDITFTGEDEDDSASVYLSSAFVRQENGKNYIYVAGADGTLEKRVIKTGRNLWGDTYEILDGLSDDDYIAFPYGRSVKVGAKIQYADTSELYSYY